MIDWVLGPKGHADEWRRVFRVEAEDAELVWESIAEAVRKARITGVRGGGNITIYSALIMLKIDDRIAPVLTAWHYAYADDTPRLVTAYPKLYTRRNGNYG